MKHRKISPARLKIVYLLFKTLTQTSSTLVQDIQPWSLMSLSVIPTTITTSSFRIFRGSKIVIWQIIRVSPLKCISSVFSSKFRQPFEKLWIFLECHKRPSVCHCVSMPMLYTFVTAEIDVNFMNTPNEFNSNERCTSNHSMNDTSLSDTPYGIIELAPEWSYCEVSSFQAVNKIIVALKCFVDSQYYWSRMQYLTIFEIVWGNGVNIIDAAIKNWCVVQKSMVHQEYQDNSDIFDVFIDNMTFCDIITILSWKVCSVPTYHWIGSFYCCAFKARNTTSY